MRGLWELPWVTVEPEEEPAERLGAVLRKRYGVETGPLRRAAGVRHAILNRDLRAEAYRGTVRWGPRRGAGARWFPPEEMTELPLSSLVRKLLDATS